MYQLSQGKLGCRFTAFLLL